jgi:hypothetical protein
MSKAQTDIRTTSYDALSARPFGYQGTIDEVIAQIRDEDDLYSSYFSDRPTGRSELLHFLGADKSVTELSGFQLKQIHMPAVYVFPMNEDEDWSVHYGEPDSDSPKKLGVYDPGFYSLAHAKARGWV